MRRNYLHLSATLALAGLALAAAACGDDSSDPTNPPPVDDASLRVINTSAGAVDVTVDGTVVAQNVAAGSVSQRLGIAAGDHSVQLRLAGGGAASQSVDFLARLGRDYLVSALADGEGIAAQVDTGATPVPGKAKLRIIHMAENAPALDVWRTQPDFQTPTRIMFPFPYGSKSSFLEGDPGTWEVWVTAEGTTGPKLATSGPISLEAEWIRTLILIESPNGELQIVNEGEQP